ncbi:MAG: hypothetical protein ACREN2_08350 [Candidatus Dormibacteria bacterium]
MTYEVTLERAVARPFASVRETVLRKNLGGEIRRLLDMVWPEIRRQNVSFDHNVIVYRGGDADSLDVEAGVETLSAFAASGNVRPSHTPAGDAVTAAHYGDYAQLGDAYAALETWCAPLTAGHRVA